MGRTTFSDAVDTLRTLGSPADKKSFRLAATLETVVLDHEPRSYGDAAAMLDVVIPEVATGGRSDGRDVKALKASESC